jgi:hypothetical protein
LPSPPHISHTTAFCASDLGIGALGIELLPIGQYIIKARNLLHYFSNDDFETLIQWKNKKPWIEHQRQHNFTILKITDGTYSEENNNLIKNSLSCLGLITFLSSRRQSRDPSLHQKRYPAGVNAAFTCRTI